MWNLISLCSPGLLDEMCFYRREQDLVEVMTTRSEHSVMID